MARRQLLRRLFALYVGIVGASLGAVVLVAITSPHGTLAISVVLSGLFAFTAAVLAGGVITRQLAREVEGIRVGAQRFADGELSHQIPLHDSAELGGLARSLNRMAHRLSETVATLTEQTREQQAVLSSMMEGVLAIDNEGRIISLNEAAAKLMGVDPQRALDKRITEVIRNTQLQQFVARTLASSGPVEADIMLPRAGEEAFLQAHGTLLRDAADRAIGALVVVNDVTRLRRLENMRRDFVANVSHELKTPITSIKGFIETLRDGAITDGEKVEDFLAIIVRQADRLNAIIEDLLRLSRIEQDQDRGLIELVPYELQKVLNAAVVDCQRQATDKQIHVEVRCDDDLTAHLNPQLLEQAVVNLLDNAIKYSEGEGIVLIEAERRAGEVHVNVSDQGPGIAQEHLNRLFERFYRVDKARSRKLGGTGLGLAIVKHIAQAHRGRVTVSSELGEGSTFTISFPAAPPQPRPGREAPAMTSHAA